MNKAVLFATAMMLAAPGQQSGTLTPGQPTQARVWIENRGVAEAIPVSLQQVDPRTSMRVEFAGTPIVQIAGTPTVQTRPAPQQVWQYQTLTIQPGADPTAALNAAGQQGWETTGHQFASANGTLVVLKRPR